MKYLIVFLLLFSANVYAEKVKDFNLPIYQKSEMFNLAQELKTKKVLLNFWASWCTSCIQEIPQLEALKAKYGDNVTFVAINAGEKSNLIDRFLRKNKFSYIILKDEDRSFSKSLNVTSLPVTMVIDKEMNVIYRDVVPPKEL